MKIKAIAAIGKNRELGADNKLLWHLPADFKHFVQTTMGQTLIMGRKTYESIGRPLKGRETVLITRDPFYHVHGAQVAHSLFEAFEHANSRGAKEVFVCGGEMVYREALPYVEELLLTEVNFAGEADRFFPEYGHYKWEDQQLLFQWPKDTKHEYAFKVSSWLKRPASLPINLPRVQVEKKTTLEVL